MGIIARGLAAEALMELSIADGWDNNDRVAAARSGGGVYNNLNVVHHVIRGGQNPFSLDGRRLEPVLNSIQEWG